MISEIILIMTLQMFPVQLPMTEKAYNDLRSIGLIHTFGEWLTYYKQRNKTMKKIISLMILVTMAATAVFAYEPKKENVTVKRNGNIEYYEKTELWNIHGWRPIPNERGVMGNKLTRDYVKWVIRKGYTVEDLVNYGFKSLEGLRPHINEYGILVQATGKLAEYNKKTAIISIPFVTEENYLTLTKEEMLVKMYAFIEECTK